ncbi:hypothetical protein HCW_03230 [Helicobacter cetorum MIT 00-7128]|uniref:Uncharacterized protein n=2 Tax=Helicobacter cetorum TaxID=138563 RepID=I0ELV8_HELC0|nr:hypothetical protein HCW_03230 [Helicobacter cetorum MIT 00-7128]
MFKAFLLFLINTSFLTASVEKDRQTNGILLFMILILLGFLSVIFFTLKWYRDFKKVGFKKSAIKFAVACIVGAFVFKGAMLIAVLYYSGVIG